MINILVQYQSLNLYIPFGNIQVIYLHWLNKIRFFQQSWNLLSSSFIKTESTTAYFSLFTELCLGTIKICKIVCHNLNYRCAASSPYPGSSSDSANCSPICDRCWAMYVHLGLGQAAWWRAATKTVGGCPILGYLQSMGWTHLVYIFNIYMGTVFLPLRPSVQWI